MPKSFNQHSQERLANTESVTLAFDLLSHDLEERNALLYGSMGIELAIASHRTNSRFINPNDVFFRPHRELLGGADCDILALGDITSEADVTLFKEFAWKMYMATSGSVVSDIALYRRSLFNTMDIKGYNPEQIPLDLIQPTIYTYNGIEIPSITVTQAFLFLTFQGRVRRKDLSHIRTITDIILKDDELCKSEVFQFALRRINQFFLNDRNLYYILMNLYGLAIPDSIKAQLNIRNRISGVLPKAKYRDTSDIRIFLTDNGEILGKIKNFTGNC